MSTRSRIGIIEADGTVTSIYCHNDGYPSYNGRVLFQHYKNEEKIRDLISLGNISSLGEEIGEKIDFDNYQLRENNKQVVAYKRDRGEVNSTAINHDNNDWPVGVDYVYLFDKGVWKYCDCYKPEKLWVELTEDLWEE